MNLRKIMIGAVVASALAVVPAQAPAKTDTLPAGVYVCNTANGNGSGSLTVLAADPQGGLNSSSGLTAKSVGNANAAMHSAALALCGAPADLTPTPPADAGSGGIV